VAAWRQEVALSLHPSPLGSSYFCPPSWRARPLLISLFSVFSVSAGSFVLDPLTPFFLLLSGSPFFFPFYFVLGFLSIPCLFFPFPIPCVFALLLFDLLNTSFSPCFFFLRLICLHSNMNDCPPPSFPHFSSPLLLSHAQSYPPPPSQTDHLSPPCGFQLFSFLTPFFLFDIYCEPLPPAPFFIPAPKSNLFRPFPFRSTDSFSFLPSPRHRYWDPIPPPQTPYFFQHVEHQFLKNIFLSRTPLC